MKKVYVLLIISLIFKIIFAYFLPISQDESYYWVWSHHIQLSYFDHPGMIAWLIWLGHFLEPFGQLFRLPTVFVGHLMLLVWVEILKNHIDSKKIFYWLLLMNTIPLTGIGTLLTTPDVPFLLFASLSIYFLENIFRSNSLKYHALLGASLGLGFISKYHTVLLLPVIILSAFFNGHYKRTNKLGVLLVVLFGVIFSLPVFVWNFQNDFQSFIFQIKHGLNQKNWEPFWTYSYIIGQILILFPIVFFLAVRRKLKNGEESLFFLAWVPLIFFFITSFKGPVEPNWPVMAIPAFLALATLETRNTSVLKIPILFWGLISLMIIVQYYNPLMKQVPEKLNEARYFDPIYDIKDKYKPVYFGSYQMASKVWYEFKTPAKKLYYINRYDYFDELSKGIPIENPFYVIKETWVPLPDWINEGYSIKKIENVGEKFEVLLVNKI